MTFQLFVVSLLVAGIATGWRNLLSDIPTLSNIVKKLPYLLRKPVQCGFCFTFWLALAAVLTIDVLPGFSLVLNFDAPVVFASGLEVLARWMAVGMLSVIIRFGYVALQELVHYQVHEVRGKHSH